MSKELTATLAIVGVIAAVGFIAWLAHALGFRGGRRIAGETEINALSAPFGGARRMMIDSDGSAAIALLPDGRLLAAKVMGNEIVTRVFAKTQIASLGVSRPGSAPFNDVTIQFKDFSFPSIKLKVMETAPPNWLDELRMGATE